MKLLSMLIVTSSMLVLSASGAFAANDSKHISDGAAKGQATEGTAQPATGGKPCKPTRAKPCPVASTTPMPHKNHDSASPN